MPVDRKGFTASNAFHDRGFAADKIRDEGVGIRVAARANPSRNEPSQRIGDRDVQSFCRFQFSVFCGAGFCFYQAAVFQAAIRKTLEVGRLVTD